MLKSLIVKPKVEISRRLNALREPNRAEVYDDGGDDDSELAEEEANEKGLVFLGNAVVHPGAVVVKVSHARLAHVAVHALVLSGCGNFAVGTEIPAFILFHQIQKGGLRRWLLHF
jgi:hypothetical protein